MELKGSLPCSQQPATSPYPEQKPILIPKQLVISQNSKISGNRFWCTEQDSQSFCSHLLLHHMPTLEKISKEWNNLCHIF